MWVQQGQKFLRPDYVHAVPSYGYSEIVTILDTGHVLLLDNVMPSPKAIYKYVVLV